MILHPAPTTSGTDRCWFWYSDYTDMNLAVKRNWDTSLSLFILFYRDPLMMIKVDLLCLDWWQGQFSLKTSLQMTFSYKLKSIFTGVLILIIYSNLWHILAQNIHRTEPTDGILLFECHIEKTTYFKLGNILILYSRTKNSGYFSCLFFSQICETWIWTDLCLRPYRV